MNWKKALGFSVIYYLVRAFISLFFAIFLIKLFDVLEVSEIWIELLILPVISLLILWFLMYFLKPQSLKDKIVFACFVVGVSILLDGWLTVADPYLSVTSMLSFITLLSYLMHFLTPLTVPIRKKVTKAKSSPQKA